MPALFEGSEITGTLIPPLRNAGICLPCRWLPEAVITRRVPWVSGWLSGQAMLSLGTSGVYFAVSDGYRSNPESAVHSFCHALPGKWHLMSVMLSAASCLDWAAKLTGMAMFRR
jgi:xylulokinase